MKINYIRWNNDRVGHMGRHNITVEEVEEAVFEDRKNLTQVLKQAERNPKEKIYRTLGKTGAGRHITFIFIYEGRGVIYPVTARDMTRAERRRYSGN